ncbi:ABC transporter permease [Pontibacter sp. G13]|uniref:ABC transporter permease n=1 Tax=Pontibacter sp. G13 TaxID=3074898 RepID=UPI002889EA37|nr:ABC transporter permease [Pontibacter sp. G13]WNJ20847.1 ABC transporter permease [Pontibacter sp. G13]
MKFLARRILQGLLVIWGIVTLLFLIFYTLGDPTEYLVEDNADEATKQAIRAKYGLDKPLFGQYLHYLNGLSPIGTLDPETTQSAYLGLFPVGQSTLAIKSPDLGISYQSQRSVSEMIGSKLGGTAILAVSALVFAGVLGIFLGVISALNAGNKWDQIILSASVLGISAPSFFVGILVAWLFAVKLKTFTGLNVSGYLFEDQIFGDGQWIIWKNLFLPALALGIRPLAVFIQLTRSSMIDVLSADYVRTAKAKGLSRSRVILQHSLRNALNPVVTSMTGWLASLLAGAFFIEYIFNWQGIGKLTIDALNTNDFPVIIGCVLTIGVIFVVISIITDYVYTWLDPRVKVG